MLFVFGSSLYYFDFSLIFSSFWVYYIVDFFFVPAAELYYYGLAFNVHAQDLYYCGICNCFSCLLQACTSMNYGDFELIFLTCSENSLTRSKFEKFPR